MIMHIGLPSDITYLKIMMNISRMQWGKLALMIIPAIILTTIMGFVSLKAKHLSDDVFGISQLRSITTKLSSNSALQNDINSDAKKYILQRNNLSRMMNELAQRKSILYCELQMVQKNFKSVSETGGWCEQKVDQSNYGHVTDTVLLAALADFFAGKKVASFGDGRGYYKSGLDLTGKLHCYDAYDGGPYYDKISNGSVKYIDLTLPQYGLPLYDYVMSLEVAEHIPAQFEAIYLSNIVRHAKEGIVLSWAVPGQGGHSHVNLKPLDYVIRTLQALGFDHDLLESKNLKGKATVSWLKQNINVYRRRPNSYVDLNEI